LAPCAEDKILLREDNDTWALVKKKWPSARFADVKEG
jgi:hypothetical protein